MMVNDQGDVFTRMITIVRLSLVVALVFVAAVEVAFGGASVTVESLQVDLKSKDIDRIDKSLNDIKRMSHKGEILPFVVDLWEQRKEKYAGLPWDIVNANVVRVGIADILLQAEKNGKIKLDYQPIHQFVLSQINSNDPDVARKAIGALALVDDSADVSQIKQIALKKDPATFRIAVASLTQMCNETAKNAIADLEVEVAESDLKAYLEKRKRESDEFKKKTTWCDRGDVMSNKPK
jgi:hypothetical protein